MIYPELDISSLKPPNLPGIFFKIVKVALVDSDQIRIRDREINVPTTQSGEDLLRIEILLNDLLKPGKLEEVIAMAV